MSDRLWPHGLQHARLSYSCSLLKLMPIESVMPSNHLILIPFSSCLQSFPTSVSFPVSQFFLSGGQSIAASASAAVLPLNIQDWFPLGWTGWISLQSQGLSRVLQHHSSKASILWPSAFFIVQLSHPYMLSRLVIAFLPRSKRLLISWLQSPSAVDKPRQHIKKQRHHFGNKDLHGQSYGFSRSHVQMWELDHKEGWVLKNWCFETVVLKKTLESPLDSKEIKILMLGKIEGRRRGWQRMRWLDGITDSMDMEFEQAPGDGEGQRSLLCCSPWGHKESDMT